MKLSVMIINTLQRNKKQSEACSETSYSVTLMMAPCSSYKDRNNIEFNILEPSTNSLPIIIKLKH